MCSVPEGYGSISSWYQWRSSAPSPGAGFGVVEGSLVLPDALPLGLDLLWVVSVCPSSVRPWIQKSLSGERPWEADAAAPRCLLLYARRLCISGHSLTPASVEVMRILDFRPDRAWAIDAFGSESMTLAPLTAPISPESPFQVACVRLGPRRPHRPSPDDVAADPRHRGRQRLGERGRRGAAAHRGRPRCLRGGRRRPRDMDGRWSDGDRHRVGGASPL